MRRQLALPAACGVALVGCSPPPEEEACTMMGGQSGVGLTVVLPADDTRVSPLGRPSDTGLLPIRAQVCVERQPCRQITTDLMGGEPTPTAWRRELTGTVPIPSLEKGQKVTVALLLPTPTAGAAAGAARQSTRKSATARPYQPNGAACDGDSWAVASMTFTDADLRGAAAAPPTSRALLPQS